MRDSSAQGVYAAARHPDPGPSRKLGICRQIPGGGPGLSAAIARGRGRPSKLFSSTRFRLWRARAEGRSGKRIAPRIESGSAAVSGLSGDIDQIPRLDLNRRAENNKAMPRGGSGRSEDQGGWFSGPRSSPVVPACTALLPDYSRRTKNALPGSARESLEPADDGPHRIGYGSADRIPCKRGGSCSDPARAKREEINTVRRPRHRPCLRST